MAVNLVLERVFSSLEYAQFLGQMLDESTTRGYVLLMREPRLKWKSDNEFGKLVYERMHRNALETAARIILSDYTRRRLVNSALSILTSENAQLVRLMKNKRIPSDLVRRVKDESDKKSGNVYHYALSALRQVRRVLRKTINDSFRVPEGERCPLVRELLHEDSERSEEVKLILIKQVDKWQSTGFPFLTPVFKKSTLEFAASAENSTGQGYWFRSDSKRENEVILYIKTPPGVLGYESDSESPYKSRTVRLRFLNWLPRKAARARKNAQRAKEIGDIRRAIELEFRALRFEDMNLQLLNRIKLQQLARELARLRSQGKRYEARIKTLKSEIDSLKSSRKSAPPLIKVVGKRATLTIPFMSPDEKLIRTSLLSLNYHHRRAGVDRGLRHSMVVSVQNGDNSFEEKMIGRQELYETRGRLRQRSRILMSQIARKRNNWEKKHSGQQPPAFVLKKERELESVWQKVRRLDKEISHQVASETVWFCEHHGVKTIYFEDLRSFQGKRGMRTHSWNLSTNLWGQMIEGVRYRREALGHKNGGIKIVNPAWTSQTCHVCGERGMRVEDETSTMERKGGEYFHCSKCNEHFHADVNAARNIMYVQQLKPSAVSGRTA
ncbi:MAG: zinc ribbon domain-containing protein [Candidatus Thorarchaeota archaeon]